MMPHFCKVCLKEYVNINQHYKTKKHMRNLFKKEYRLEKINNKDKEIKERLYSLRTYLDSMVDEIGLVDIILDYTCEMETSINHKKCMKELETYYRKRNVKYTYFHCFYTELYDDVRDTMDFYTEVSMLYCQNYNSNFVVRIDEFNVSIFCKKNRHY